MAMSIGAKDDHGTMCDINTTPLIDIMLVLLVTLIVTLPVMTHAVKLDMPPPTNNPPPATLPEVINLDIYYDGAIAWNGQGVKSMEDLEAQFKQAAAEKTQPELHLAPDTHVKYDIVAKVLAAAQRNHLEKIGFVNTAQFVQF
jgi:biopolymer transport protein ExbD